ncbi:eCIS core domain-containing protein [Pseudorhodoferax sp.]|uniref:eCIS core domain-containing protein n=1 Tax=Pseudorhodoferax sp. TaxID=1993553 RepID=UPI002DD6473F|nr:DUF4157 domain-containing protein [Pseudorhodoferax sp.]
MSKTTDPKAAQCALQSAAAQRPAAAPMAAEAPLSPLQAGLLKLQRLHGNRQVGAWVAASRSGAAPAGDTPAALDQVAHGIEQARGGGQPLDNATLQRMNTAMGADFGGVRIHTDGQADQLSRTIEARAFATGRDLFFRQGAYNPGTSSGRELLAHELTHVLQQGGAGLQAKLSISQPDDPQEQEADRVAHAVMAAENGQAPAVPVVQRAGGLPAVQRDKETPPADAAPPVVAEPAPVQAPGAPAGTAAPGSTDQVTLDWHIEWINKEVGKAVSSESNARTGKDAAQGMLKVLPFPGAAGVTTMAWVNAATSGGAVHVGPWAQQKGKGGMVSTGISWGKPPSALAKVDIKASTEDPKKPTPRAVLAAKQKAASAAATAALEKALETEGGLDTLKATVLAAAQEAVGAGDGTTAFEVTADVKLDPKSAYSRAVAAVPYDGAEADARRTAVVTVPTVVQKLKGSNMVEVENRMKQTDANQASSKDAKTEETYDSKTTELITSVSTSFDAAFDQAYSDWSSKITKKSVSVSGHGEAGLGGKVGAGTELKDLTIDVGTLLGILLAAENPALAWAVKKAIGKATIGGKTNFELEGGLDLGVAGSAGWSDETVKQTLNKAESKIRTQIKTSMQSQVKTQVVNKTLHQHEDTKAEQHGKDELNAKKSASSTETIAVKYVIGEPELTVRND